MNKWFPDVISSEVKYGHVLISFIKLFSLNVCTLGVKQERQNFFSILSVVLSFINTSKGEFHRFPCAPLQSTPSLPEEAIGMSAFPVLLFSGMLYKWSPFKAGFSLSIMLLRSIQLFIDTSFFLFPNSIPLYGLNLFVHQLEGCLICFW